MSSYLWQPIEDLPENWADFRSSQLEGLINAWKSRVEMLQGSSVLESFKDSLRQEWLSEVDMLEYLYSTDRGTTQIFIEQGIEISLPTATSEARLNAIPVNEFPFYLSNSLDGLILGFFSNLRRSALLLRFAQSPEP